MDKSNKFKIYSFDIITNEYYEPNKRNLAEINNLINSSKVKLYSYTKTNLYNSITQFSYLLKTSPKLFNRLNLLKTSINYQYLSFSILDKDYEPEVISGLKTMIISLLNVLYNLDVEYVELFENDVLEFIPILRKGSRIYNRESELAKIRYELRLKNYIGFQAINQSIQDVNIKGNDPVLLQGLIRYPPQDFDLNQGLTIFKGVIGIKVGIKYKLYLDKLSYFYTTALREGYFGTSPLNQTDDSLREIILELAIMMNLELIDIDALWKENYTFKLPATVSPIIKINKDVRNILAITDQKWIHESVNDIRNYLLPKFYLSCYSLIPNLANIDLSSDQLLIYTAKLEYAAIVSYQKVCDKYPMLQRFIDINQIKVSPNLIIALPIYLIEQVDLFISYFKESIIDCDQWLTVGCDGLLNGIIIRWALLNQSSYQSLIVSDDSFVVIACPNKALVNPLLIHPINESYMKSYFDKLDPSGGGNKEMLRNGSSLSFDDMIYNCNDYETQRYIMGLRGIYTTKLLPGINGSKVSNEEKSDYSMWGQSVMEVIPDIFEDMDVNNLSHLLQN